jgi:hypothetical protein
MITTTTTNKKALSIFDDKRAWISANESLAYGHYSLDEMVPSNNKIQRLQ